MTTSTAPIVLTFAEAIAADKAAALAVVSAEQGLRDAEEILRLARESYTEAYNEMRRAEARDAAGSIPVGTRVYHRTYTDHFATVVEGTAGIAVRQDKSGEITDGFGPGEWIAVGS